MTTVTEFQHEPQDIANDVPFVNMPFYAWLRENYNGESMREILVKYFSRNDETPRELKDYFAVLPEEDRADVHQGYRWCVRTYLRQPPPEVRDFSDFCSAARLADISPDRVHLRLGGEAGHDLSLTVYDHNHEETGAPWVQHFDVTATDELHDHLSKLVYGDKVSEYYLEGVIHNDEDEPYLTLWIKYQRISGSRAIAHIDCSTFPLLITAGPIGEDVDEEPEDEPQPEQQIDLPKGAKAIDPAVRDALTRLAKWDDGKLKITGKRLERKLYVKVNECLEALGGVWHRKYQAHIFSCDGEDSVREAIELGYYTPPEDLRKKFQIFETPQPLCNDVCGPIKKGDNVLEPSAASGRIADTAREKGANVDCIEIRPEACETLQDKGYKVTQSDFLKVKPDPVYDVVAMNPPFTGGADIEHVKHALRFVKPGGCVSSIMSAGWQFRSDKRSVAFRELVDEIGTANPIDDGAFKSEGTNVKTVLVILRP